MYIQKHLSQSVAVCATDSVVTITHGNHNTHNNTKTITITITSHLTMFGDGAGGIRKADSVASRLQGMTTMRTKMMKN